MLASTEYCFDEYTVDARRRNLSKNGEVVPLTAKVFDLLLLFLENNNRVVEKERIIERLWADEFVEENNLSQCVTHLRKALGETAKNPHYIQTVPRVGFKFVADVTPIEDGDGDVDFEKETVDLSAAPVLNDSDIDEKNSVADVEESVSPLASRKSSRVKVAAVIFSVLTMLIIGAVVWRYLRSGTVSGVKSIAVLPFKTISQDTEALRQGMTDEMITRLSRIEKITVLPSSTVSRYNKPDQDPIAAARELGADTVLDGRIQNEGAQIRTTVQLIRAADGKVLWSEVFLNEPAGIFDLQHSIAYKVTEALSLELSDDEKRALMKRYTTSSEAYRLYLDAKYIHTTRKDTEARILAKKNLETALRLDPNFAMAYVQLSHMEVLEPSKEAYQRMKFLAQKAVEIDDTLGEAHEAYGFAVWRSDWNWTEAEPHYKKSIALGGNNMCGGCEYALFLNGLGRFDEARAVNSDTRFLLPNTATYATSYFSRSYDETIEQAQTRLRKNLRSLNALPFLGLAYIEKGMYREAIETMEKYTAFSELAPLNAQCYLGFAYARAGQTEKAREMLRKVKAQEAKPSDQINGSLAMLHGALGDKDEAFAYLEKAIEQREWWGYTLKVTPQFDSLRDDPRFDEMLRRVNLSN